VDRVFGRVYEDTGKGTSAQTLPSFTLTVLALDRDIGCLRCSKDDRELRIFCYMSHKLFPMQRSSFGLIGRRGRVYIYLGI
jgi:hypothetical protein